MENEMRGFRRTLVVVGNRVRNIIDWVCIKAPAGDQTAGL